MKLTIWIRRIKSRICLPKTWFSWVVLSYFLFLVCVSLAVGAFWKWFTINESEIAIVRNFFLAIVAIFALPLALWRSWVAERQLGTAQRGQLNERYQKGAEMLGSQLLSIRLGGIYALQQLVQNHPQEYHIQIMRLFCAFLRENVSMSRANEEVSENEKRLFLDNSNKDYGIFQGQITKWIRVKGFRKLNEDCQAIVDAFYSRTDTQFQVQENEGYLLDLTNLDLKWMDLRDAKFHNVDLTGTDLSGAILWGANFRKAFFVNTIMDYAGLDGSIFDSSEHLEHNDPPSFVGANMFDVSLDGMYLFGAQLTDANLRSASLVGAHLANADLAGAKMGSANISGASFSESSPYRRFSALGLTQAQLDTARGGLKEPPFLEGVIDAETGKALVWRN